MPTTVRSRAKINLGLYLGALRPDGFHSLTTVYQTLEMHDIVTVTARPAATTEIRIACSDSRVPTDSRNTAWKMVSLALEEFGLTANVGILIEKRLPVQGGLGAGSGNAVAALIGLEMELGLPHPRDLFTYPLDPDGGDDDDIPVFLSHMNLAAQVGSDVPLFLVGGAVLGLDRGQEVYSIYDIEPVWCVVVVPDTGVSTPQAFRDRDTLCAAEGLTAGASADRLEELSRAYDTAFRGAIPKGGEASGSSGVLAAGKGLAGPQESVLVRTGITSWIENDFERVVFPQHPSLAEIKRLLAAPGKPEAAVYASLSGSGSALFGLYRIRGDAEAARDRIGTQSQALGVQSIELTRTLPRPAYWDQMLKGSF